MWPFDKKIQTSNTDPYWDYLDPDQFMRDPRFVPLTEEERVAVQRGLAEFKGQRLHPEIAESTFGAFSAASIATYALDLARDGSNVKGSVLTIDNGSRIDCISGAQVMFPI